MAKGVTEIHTEASRISRPFFEKHGYFLVEIEHVIRFDVEFERFRMTKKIRANQALQHNDPSCHVPCLRTYRASRGRG